MTKESKETEKSFKETITKNKDKILGDTVIKYDQTVIQEKKTGRDALERIEETAKIGTEFIKSRPYWESIKNSSQKLKEKGIEQEKKLKKQSPKLYRKIINGFFYFFEILVGRIKLGTQYGVSSLELLEKLARLKELGVLTDEEFAKKKKKILDRI
ncbi:MAG: SHOCT domain-containing protein [Nitrosopumilus sp.]|uniref:SHOCT domain-containing protein n=1 Tax=Nitrosopumilus sp. TaxID=2024843 RepID=UPI00246E9D92|nr:SHOCT domain-containing protein [Nitrosopumilus sp.]MDH5431660.1 SHOCT domain-containing protein [Nitrosopumilus sp.]